MYLPGLLRRSDEIMHINHLVNFKVLRVPVSVVFITSIKVVIKKKTAQLIIRSSWREGIE